MKNYTKRCKSSKLICFMVEKNFFENGVSCNEKCCNFAADLAG